MIAIVDYDAGNTGSVANALQRLGAKYEITHEAERIKAAAGVIFPGQGRAGQALAALKRAGLDGVLPGLTQPFLGICLGMQLMLGSIEEDEATGLGIIPGSCHRFVDIEPVPHMGWNTLAFTQKSPLFDGVAAGSYQYFVHSYAATVPPEFVLATTDYGGPFASAIGRDNFYGVQFHPEKSANVGERILANFLKLCEAAQ